MAVRQSLARLSLLAVTVVLSGTAVRSHPSPSHLTGDNQYHATGDHPASFRLSGHRPLQHQLNREWWRTSAASETIKRAMDDLEAVDRSQGSSGDVEDAAADVTTRGVDDQVCQLLQRLITTTRCRGRRWRFFRGLRARRRCVRIRILARFLAPFCDIDASTDDAMTTTTTMMMTSEMSTTMAAETEPSTVMTTTTPTTTVTTTPPTTTTTTIATTEPEEDNDDDEEEEEDDDDDEDDATIISEEACTSVGGVCQTACSANGIPIVTVSCPGALVCCLEF